jgi:Protein of unknown function (DUF1573)
MNMNRRTIFFKAAVLPALGLLFCMIAGCKGGSKPLLTSAAVEKEIIDLGKLRLNHPADAVFKLTNTGKNNLLIESVAPDCHCTNVVWDDKPVAPGAVTLVKTTYDSSIPGLFQKLIQVNANVEGSPLVLIIRGNVEE